ncbi:MAG: glycosyltransferase family 4 protein [Flavobacteriaceae bacterium]|nr:glycosyltransferase family 4 protein [Flavobacteriaceae bacterium]
MNKTIWVINQTAGTLDSGWGERHLMLSRYWVKKGYDVKIISGSYNHLFINQPNVKNKTYAFEEVEVGITFCWVKTPKYYDGGYRKFWSNLIFMLRLFFIPTKKLRKPDYIIVSSMPIFPIINGYLFKKRFNSKKLIIEIRDLWPLTPIYLKGYSNNHPLVKIIGLFEMFAYKKSDYIVSLLPNAASYINNISKKPDKFKWIPNGIDKKYLKAAPLDDGVVTQLPKDKFIVGYTGTMGMANALEYFIEASTILQDKTKIHFVLVGNGYLKNTLQKQTKEQKNITFIPKINKEKVQSMLDYFDLCFIGRNDTPLFNYGVSSNKYFDYMLSKTPVLVSSNLIKDPVELSGCGITVKPENAQAVADGILTFFEMDESERNIMGIKGYDYVKKYHNFTVLSQSYLSLFNSND